MSEGSSPGAAQPAQWTIDRGSWLTVRTVRDIPVNPLGARQARLVQADSNSRRDKETFFQSWTGQPKPLDLQRQAVARNAK